MRNRVLLSIKPVFAEKIFDGDKLYEFRRVLFKRDDITKVVVYASAPVQKVIGEFEIDELLSLSKSALWDIAAAHAGIEKSYFDTYFRDKTKAHAIKIKNPKRYKKPRDLESEFNLKSPPQSFAYV